MKSLVGAALLSILIITPSLTLEAQEAPGVATGTKIGNIVKSAIDTALPGVTSLVNLIWGTHKADDKVSKTDLTSAVASAQTTMRAQTLTKLTDVSHIADELTLVNQFMLPAVNAEMLIARMRARIFGVASLSDGQWSDQTVDWESAKIQLGKVKSVADSEIDKTAREEWLRFVLKKIRDTNDGLRVQVDQAMKNKDLGRLGQPLTDLSVTLDMAQVAGGEISDLKTDLTALSDWASGKPPAHAFTTEKNEFRLLLDKKYPPAK